MKALYSKGELNMDYGKLYMGQRALMICVDFSAIGHSHRK